MSIFRHKILFLAGFLMSISFQAFAAEPPEVGQLVPKTGDYFLEILFSLVLVLGIIFFSAWMLRRYGRFPGVADGNLRVLGALSVGQRERILLLQVGSEQVLVGVTTSRITKLHELKNVIEFSDSNLAKKSSVFAQNLREALQNSEKEQDNPNDSLPAGKKNSDSVSVSPSSKKDDE